jgi:hypothetical protein
MPKKRPQPGRSATQPGAATPKPIPRLPAEAVLSFLKDTNDALTWFADGLAETLKGSRREAEQVIALFGSPAATSEPTSQMRASNARPPSGRQSTSQNLASTR